MRCRFCQTEIADKALICYRCGRATSDPKVAPVPIGRSRPTAAAAALLGVLGGGAALLPTLADGGAVWAGEGGLAVAALATVLWWIRGRR